MSASIDGERQYKSHSKTIPPLRTLKFFLALREYWDFKNLFVVLPLVLSFGTLDVFVCFCGA